MKDATSDSFNSFVLMCLFVALIVDFSNSSALNLSAI